MKIDRPITIAVTLLIIILLVFFLVVPEYKKFKILQTELGQKTAEFNAEYDYYAAITKTYYELQSRKEDVEKIDDALPQDPNLGKLIYFLEKTATENGLIIKNLFLSKMAQGNAQGGGSKSVSDIVFSMDLLGGYSSLGRFIISLENSSRIFEVTNISFSSVSGASLGFDQSLSQFQTSETYNFSVQIKTHSY